MLESIDTKASVRRALSVGRDFADIHYEDGAFQEDVSLKRLPPRGRL